MKILLFAGAGTSVELGVPSMTGLAAEFLTHTQQWAIEPDLVRRIMENNLDIEHLIEELDRVYVAEPSLKHFGHKTNNLENVEKVRAEVEWFVQHAAERIVAKDAQLMWGSILKATEAMEITFVTTNYDRAIELAANAEGIFLNDGFTSFSEKETVPWIGFGHDRQQPMLVKLHGSTDWFADKNQDNPMKLRHPMPLFGRSVLLLEGLELDSALVLPSREKMLTRAPYPRLSQTFLNAADHCDLALFVGSSLRDNHIRDAARSIVQKAPVFIVNPNGDNREIEDATIISQHASTFLMSTLPNALATSDPSDFLQKVSGTSNSKTHSILPAVRDLLNTHGDTNQRCHAIEELDEAGATLAPLLIEQVLHDKDSTVARYGLGLVPLSTSREQLIEVAANCPHNGNLAFDADLTILRNLVSTAQRDGVSCKVQLLSNDEANESGVTDLRQGYSISR